MLCLFDLDDTLINTKYYFVPRKLSVALDRMLDAGLEVDGYFKALQLLERLNILRTSSKGFIQEFVELYDGTKNHYLAGCKALFSQQIDKLDIDLFDGVNELFEQISLNHILAIVTKGKKELQLKKIQLSGLLSSFLNDVVVVSDHKLYAYENLALKHQIPFSQVIVTGDKEDVDILPAKEMGGIGVLMKKEDEAFSGGQFVGDHVISDIRDVAYIIDMKERLKIWEEYDYK